MSSPVEIRFPGSVFRGPRSFLRNTAHGARNTLICLTLAACGFQPLYGKPSPERESSALAGVQISPKGIIDRRMVQQFKADLEDRFNPDGTLPANPAYSLEVSLIDSEAPIGAARDGTISRYNIYLDSKYLLTRLADGAKITGGDLRHVSSYNNLTNAYFSTYVSREDAIKRGITELAEQYRHRLAPYLSGQKSDPNVDKKTNVLYENIPEIYRTLPGRPPLPR